MKPTPKISLSLSIQELKSLLESAQKTTSPEHPKCMKIDIYVAPAEPATGYQIPKGPIEVPRGSWVLQPPAPRSADKN